MEHIARLVCHGSLVPHLAFWRDIKHSYNLLESNETFANRCGKVYNKEVGSFWLTDMYFPPPGG